MVIFGSPRSKGLRSAALLLFLSLKLSFPSSAMSVVSTWSSSTMPYRCYRCTAPQAAQSDANVVRCLFLTSLPRSPRGFAHRPDKGYIRVHPHGCLVAEGRMAALQSTQFSTRIDPASLLATSLGGPFGIVRVNPT